MGRRSFLLLPVTFLFSFILFGTQLYAQSGRERVISFRSEIRIHRDASMTVTETIKVNATGDQIKHGIYRDFPTRYRDRYGNNYAVDFEVTEVLQEGVPQSYHFKDLSNGRRVYIGDKDVFLSPGEYTYTLVYNTNRQLGFFKDFDELYWNVTGNDWPFPIDEVSAIVRLPEGAEGKIINLDAYTGRMGSKEKSFRVSQDDFLGTVTFTTTRVLMPKEGLTIAASWPKGYVLEPNATDKLGYLFRDNGSVIVGLLGLLILLAYYISVWSRFGRDPSRGVIIPLFSPPDNLSPAALRYIMKMGFDHKALAAAIINMAVKGYLKIFENAGIYTIKKTGADDSVLTPEELVVSRQLLGPDTEIKLKKENHLEISGTLRNLQLALEKKFEKVYFLTNREYFFTGALISAIAMAATVIALGVSEKLFLTVFMSVWLTGWSFGVLMLLKQAISLWKLALRGGGGRSSLFGGALFMTIFAVPFIAGEIFGLGVLIGAASPWVAAVLICAVSINALFYRLLKAPTLTGRKVMDKIEGFKMYLSVAEKDRLNLLNPPEKTPELFERYLPYAFALDVEQAWSEQFSGILQSVADPHGEYSPAWYSGATTHGLGAAGFVSGLGSSLSGAISSSSTAPGSSSGSGGGGSSGGGGGGGGGGGW